MAKKTKSSIWSGKEHFMKRDFKNEKKKEFKAVDIWKFIKANRSSIIFLIVLLAVILITSHYFENNERITDSPIEVKQADTDEQDIISEAPLKEFDMLAKMYIFEPNEITVNKGDMVRLNIKSVDINHSLEIPAFFIQKTIPAGEEVTINFIAAKEGEFVFMSKSKDTMQGKIIIVE